MTPAAATALAAIVDDVAARGYAIARDFVAAADVAALRADARRRDRAGEFAAAAIGHGVGRDVRADVRGDRICWIGAPEATPAEARLLATLDGLRLALNRELMLGIFELESHYAIYPPGAGYARHVDRFRDDDARALSLVLYLNAGWRPEDGGVLHLAVDEPGDGVDVVPQGGTLVTFLADRFPHEVRPAARERVSIAGWFRRRA